MRRVFWSLYLTLREAVLKLFGRKRRDESITLHDAAKVEGLSNGENAKEVDSYSATQIQQAKDFIWKWMDEANKRLIIGMATLSTHERHGLYVKQIFAELEGKQINNKITYERMLIGVDYSDKPQYPPSAETPTKGIEFING